MIRARGWILLALLAVAPACDLRVDSGQVTVLANRGAVFGVQTPNAVVVNPGGTLVVQDADLFGLGRAVDTLPQGAFPAPGSAIRSSGGTVRVVSGTVAGGNVLVRIDPSTVPPPPPDDPVAVRIGLPRESIALLAPAIDAANSSVEILGGTLVSSGAFGQLLPYVPRSIVMVTGGRLQIRGGVFRVGDVSGPFRDAAIAVVAFGAAAEISGGTFGGVVELLGSNSRISGGRFDAGLLVGGLQSIGAPSLIVGLDRLLPDVQCTEIRGGSFSSVGVLGGIGKVFVFGTGFNLPLGPVPFTSDPRRGSISLTGVYPDGAPIAFTLAGTEDAQVFLVPPESLGCSS